MMMTLKPVPDHVLRQIVDDIFIPLVTAGSRPADLLQRRARARPGPPSGTIDGRLCSPTLVEEPMRRPGPLTGSHHLSSQEEQ